MSALKVATYYALLAYVIGGGFYMAMNCVASIEKRYQSSQHSKSIAKIAQFIFTLAAAGSAAVLPAVAYISTDEANAFFGIVVFLLIEFPLIVLVIISANDSG